MNFFHMQSGYWRVGSWNAIPFFFHWSVLLWLPWHWWYSRSFSFALLSMLAFFLVMLVHELGHAFVASARGVDVLEIRLYLFHGYCTHHQPKHEIDDMLIAWGGVLAQLALLLLALAVQYGLHFFPFQIDYWLKPLFFVLIPVNACIVVFNLIPRAPLDGHKAWRILAFGWRWFAAHGKPKWQALAQRLNFKKRRAVAEDSERITAQLLDKLRKKKD